MENPCSENPQKDANFFSLLFMTWMHKILLLGRKRSLTEDDLYSLLDDNKAKNIVDSMERCWDNEIRRAQRKHSKPKLWRAFLHFLSFKSLIAMVIAKVVQSLCSYSLAVTVWYFLKALSESDVDVIGAIPYVVGISLTCFLKVLMFHHLSYQANLKGLRAKVALTGLIYKKILFARRCQLENFTTGRIINLVANDATAIDKGISDNLTYGTAFPFEITGCVVLLWWFIGWQALIGALYFGIVLILNTFLSYTFGFLHSKAATVTDTRLEVLNSIICGIRAVKMYAWEWNFKDLVESIRRKEIGIFRTRSLIYAIVSGSYPTATPIALFITISIILATGVPLTQFNVFTELVLLTLLRNTICVNTSIQALFFKDSIASLKRIQDVLTLLHKQNDTIFETWKENKAFGDMDKIQFKTKEKRYSQECFGNRHENNVILRHSSTLISEKETKETTSNLNLSMENAYATWKYQSDECCLQEASLEIPPQQLVIVTGAVGSGKTSLLLTFLGELSVKTGTVKGQQKIAYSSQIPWIFSGTIRENILFGNPLDIGKYQKVLRACDLETDMKGFSKGDLSFIGYRGVCLSGGQRARVNLARALYYDADVYLLDDPLSAVDAKVGRHLLDNCICGILSQKTRLLVTHQTQFLGKADSIVLMEGGRIKFKGNFEGFKASSFCDANIIRKQRKGAFLSSENRLRSESSKFENDALHLELQDDGEEMLAGSISWRVYWSFFRAGLPSSGIALLVAMFLASEVSQIAPKLWLSHMVNMTNEDQNLAFYIGILSALVAIATLITVLLLISFLKAVLRSSAILHDQMTVAILKSPVLFIDMNPVGRIINRFSKDTRCIEQLMPRKFVYAIWIFIHFLGAMVLTALVEYWFAIAVVPIVLLFAFVCWFTLKSSRDFKRMESTRCSPIYAHIADTIRGLEEIHVAKMEKEFVVKLCRYLDDHAQASHLDKSCRAFLGLYVDMICAAFTGCIAIGSLLVSQNSAFTGLLISYSIELIEETWYGVASYSETENYMTSAERVIAYTQLPPEPAYSRKSLPPDNWPDKGAITFQDVSFSYTEDGNPVLKNINFNVLPYQKVGIVGRTGAGKSSLVAALFRMPDPKGSVIIDGVDLGTIDIQAARRSMAVITQDSILFASTVRQNLDPFEQFTDEQIWGALEAVQLKGTIQNTKGGLGFKIEESGSRLSVGERQLVCLARALLQRNKVLIMDEATANVDLKTDQLIQEVIRVKFQYCTVLTIAHRLNTIMDYDKVLVMEDGCIVEYDSPHVLVNKVGGAFSMLLSKWQTED